jgi:hypothetical protein
MLRVAAVVVAVALITGACAGSAPAPSPSGAPSSTAPSTTPSPSVAESAAPTGIDLSAVPTACINLGMDDCRRVIAEVAALVPAGTTATYVQVGPFGCAAGEGCVASLAERPQGDVTLEAAAGALSYHVTVVGDGAALKLDRQDAFGVLLGPTSQPPVTAGARPFSLGHCGLWSGIDVGGSWWDPVGQVDGDHPDAINAAEGSLAIIDPDHATFMSRGGLTVQLQRHQGDKYLPLCQ